MDTPSVLIIDDDQDVTYALTRATQRLGYNAESAATVQRALALAAEKEFDAIFLDVLLPDGNGLDIIPDLMNTPAHPELIIITGNGDPDGAELAISNGAWDYIEKGDSLQGIMDTLSNALEYRKDKYSYRKVRQIQVLHRENIIGESRAIMHSLQQVAELSASDVSIFITGETGTGKELFAKALHNNSARKKDPFVVVDCAALPESLAESILFGHKKGAFTGAMQDSDGLILQANNGTLFLDEVGELPLAIQKTFLRVLQERTIRPVGSEKEIPCNFRLLSATNKNIDAMQEEGTFRADLAYRIRSAEISLPPLRERKQDILLLVDHYVSIFLKKQGCSSKAVCQKVITALQEYQWPGNVRELISTIEYIVSTSHHESRIFIKHLPPAFRAKIARQRIAPPQKEYPANFSYEANDDALPTMQEHRTAIVEKAEIAYLTQLLNATKGSIKKAIGLSGLSQSRFYALLKKYNLS